MPEGGADVVDYVGADLDQPHFSKPVHIGPTPMGTSVLMQTRGRAPSDCSSTAALPGAASQGYLSPILTPHCRLDHMCRQGAGSRLKT